jgi:DNA-3-methyladenine glycosylase I
MKARCFWVSENPLYVNYHDQEWGKPVYEDAIFFEFLLLETFQAGLSWLTILNKRDNFRGAFDDFDYQKIAKYSDKKFEALMQDKGIVRNALKIKSAISNAQFFMEIQQEFGSFSTFIWRYVDQKSVLNKFQHREEMPTTTPLSDQISKDLKRRGFKFVGSTIIYAFLQATGIVNDHTTDCFKHLGE